MFLGYLLYPNPEGMGSMIENERCTTTKTPKGWYKGQRTVLRNLDLDTMIAHHSHLLDVFLGLPPRKKSLTEMKFQ
ncbi:hypothetical protein ADIS_4373 [Lunatimonas lonarensis]|uniref:Uncharacterized protein n=1 Tax=Lunatimonas lonarensis TaxID=1232681 RepID=R7ZM98_9BACT|nr:hypothetical protein ADIS_4373 [Lunatimonas lonarensis]